MQNVSEVFDAPYSHLTLIIIDLAVSDGVLQSRKFLITKHIICNPKTYFLVKESFYKSIERAK